MSRARIKPVKCWAIVRGTKVLDLFWRKSAFLTRPDERWIRVEIRPVPRRLASQQCHRYVRRGQTCPACGKFHETRRRAKKSRRKAK